MDEPVITCKNCMQKGHSFVGQGDKQSVKTKCTKWLENCEPCDDTSSFRSSEYTSATWKSFEHLSTHGNEHILESQNVWCSSLIESLDKIYETTEVNGNDAPTFGNINIHKSRKIHVGNVTYITGPVCFNQNASLKKKSRTTNTILLREISEQIENFQGKENTLVVHLNQTIHVRSKSWRQIFGDCLFRFMELCMKLVDGA